jgi:signal transduction histidine kinase
LKPFRSSVATLSPRAIGFDENGTVLVTTGIQNVDDHYLLSTFGGASGLVSGTYASLEIHDSGCGMDEATLNRIFDPRPMLEPRSELDANDL